MTRVDILPIIAEYIRQHQDSIGDMAYGAFRSSRADLIAWLKEKNINDNTMSLAEVHGLTYEGIGIAVDCLIVAGFGIEQEQDSTVYGAYSRS